MASYSRLWVVLLALFGAALLTGLLMPPQVSAATVVVPDASVGAGSCNRTGNSGQPDETYCSWDGTGDAPTIGDNSCTDVGSCTDLPDGAFIGNGSCTGGDACNQVGMGTSGSGFASVGNDACIGSGACRWAGRGDPGSGHAEIGNGACNGPDACDSVGSANAGDGYANIGNGSCNGAGACQRTGDGGVYRQGNGHTEVGNGSCIGEDACSEAGQGSFGNGHLVVGNRSCIGSSACILAGGGDGGDGQTEIREGSCVGDSACYRAGLGIGSGSASIGSFSCRTTDQNGDTDACRVIDSVSIGDCVYNDVEPEECIETITLQKYLFPFWDSGRFFLSVQGVDENLGPYGHNGSTGPIEVDPGVPYTVSEAGANASLNNYRATIVCRGAKSGIVAYGFGTSTTVVVPEFDQVTCTFINQRIWSWFWWR